MKFQHWEKVEEPSEPGPAMREAIAYAKRLRDNEHAKTCRCGARYTRGEWAALPWMDPIDGGDSSENGRVTHYWVALRLCPTCLTTMAITLNTNDHCAELSELLAGMLGRP